MYCNATRSCYSREVEGSCNLGSSSGTNEERSTLPGMGLSPPRSMTRCSNLSLDSFACGTIAMPCSEELALVVICSSSYSPSGEESPESSRLGG